MRLPFQRDPQRDARGAADLAPRGADLGDEAIAAARLSARRRLIGATVLLGVGVAGFPLLFDTQPRPLPANLPIVTASNETSRPAAAAAPSAATRSAASRPAEPASAPEDRVVASASAASSTASEVAAVATKPAAASAPAEAASNASVAKPAASAAPSLPRAGLTAASATPAAPAPVPAASRTPPPAPAANPAPAAAPNAPRASAPPRAAEPAAADGRYVVQVGAYSDAAMLRETRQKVEKLGLKTYTQVIEGDAGRRTRVRVGPFATRAEAQAAVSRLKAAGLPANLLTL